MGGENVARSWLMVEIPPSGKNVPIQTIAGLCAYAHQRHAFTHEKHQPTTL